MLRKTVQVILVFTLALTAIWFYMRLVAEPLIRDINHSKRESREIKSQWERLEDSHDQATDLNALEVRRLKTSRRLLANRLSAESPLSRSWPRLAAGMRSRARVHGLRVLALDEAPMTQMESNQADLPISGTVTYRVSARIRGSLKQWGPFLVAVSRLPAYLTLVQVYGIHGKAGEMRVDWVWHRISPEAPLPSIRAELMDPLSPLLDRRLPPLNSGNRPLSGGR